MDTKELVERLRKIADASRRADGTDIPLGQELRAAYDAIERLERERDEANANARMYEATAKEAARGLECLSDIDDAWDAIGSRGNRKALTLAEQISSLARELDDAEAELTTLRARVAKMEEALEWALNNCTESDHPHYPYCRDGKWVFPYLASNAGGFGGGVADAYYDTALEAVLSAKESTS